MLENYDITVAIPKTADLEQARRHILYAWSRILTFKKNLQHSTHIIAFT